MRNPSTFSSRNYDIYIVDFILIYDMEQKDNGIEFTFKDQKFFSNSSLFLTQLYRRKINITEALKIQSIKGRKTQTTVNAARNLK